MGLDQYLYRKTYVKQWDWMKPEDRYEVTVTKGGKPVTAIDPTLISYVTEQVGYWRKANAIHGWFVDNVQGGKDECQESYVSEDDLRALLAKVEKVLAAEGTPQAQQVAERELPVRGGFFFGSYEYDEWYFNDLRDTVVIIKRCLENSEGADFYYDSSW